MEQIELTTLNNGLRVASERMDGVGSVAAGLWVAAGSRRETPGQSGLAHFLEHMSFKGTGSRNARQIAEAIEGMGGYANAGTGHETTSYYVRLMAEDMAPGLEIIADIIRNSLYDPEETERERSVILQEIGMYEDTPDEIVFDRFQQAAWPDQPLGRPILGTGATVSALQPEDMREFVARWYVPGDMIVAAAGQVDHDALCRVAERCFGDLPPGGGGDLAPAVYGGGEVRESRDTEQIHVVLGFPAPGILDERFDRCRLLASILGGGMSSRLFQEVRERRGLVYSVHAGLHGHPDTSALNIYAGADPARAAELTETICREIIAIRTRISEDELARVRKQHKAALVMGREQCLGRAGRLARELLLWNRIIPLAEKNARLDAVDTAGLIEEAGELFAAPPTLAAVGKPGTLPALDQIRDTITCG